MESKYKIGQKVYHIKIDKYNEQPSIYSYKKDGIKVENLEILGISPYKICLNNDWFTAIDVEKEGRRKDRSIYSYMDDISVSIRTNGSILGDGVFISLFSTKPPTKKLLNKMVATAKVEIDKKYGFLFNGAVDELYDMVETVNL